ncbi:Lysine exporter protein (LYSE/YGGA) [Kribbella flavida DSM 17836]|uniref:Lysine exporter protein (LYSE/YGGA) n=1 Tax=Kribbella flavida (strain DSM 17836 / JCM 10339 / NBRC 14399) TaxID=479435 RepID=D2PZ17_KRIFD|nr:LysE family translocator [Kribbella flavida]ADB31811.1 Lysine exporter protein (LYSE/YGGA) [Kribbella flavida DSM 17836]
MSATTVLGFALACVLLNLVPGPGMMFIVAHGLGGGRRAGVTAALGMASGTVVHTVVAALGLSALLQAAPFALELVRVGGAVFLLYLAVSAFRSARAAAALTAPPRKSLRRTYLSAVLTNLANPKVVLFYLAFLPQFLTAGGWPGPVQILLLGAVLVLIGLVMDCGVGVAAGALSAVLVRRPGFERGLKRVAGAVFGGLAVRLLLDAR